MNKLKVGVVGCGFIAKKRHIPAFLRLKKNVKLSAVCDLNQELAKNVAQEFGIPNVYSDLSDMLSEENLDIVDVCTPPKIHAPVALEAMKSGCNVLLEKPMAPSLSDCDEIVEAYKKYGVKLSVVHNQNFYPTFLKAQKLVDSGVIGKLLGMRVLILTTRDVYIAHEDHWIHKLPGGAIGETGPHAVYMSLAFLKNAADVNVCARRQSDYPWVSYDDYRIELVGENLTSSIYVSHAGDCNASEVDLFGTEGIIKMDLQSMILTHHKREHIKPTSVASSSLSVAGQTLTGVVSNVFNVCFGKTMLGHDIMIEKFVESIIEDKPVPVTPEEGRETIRVMNMIVEKLS
ncbi:MAG TPA: Gfo/Idh/MocA family oxidoreductase [Bacteroidetes bacterium]|nr:Gfo/Idh/MocA family oxidoreductase [Bacteroidota bacterium]